MSYLIALGVLAGGIMLTPASDDFLVISFLLYAFSNGDSFAFSWLILWVVCFMSFTWFYVVGYTFNRVFSSKRKSSKHILRAQALIERHGHRMIFISYFIPGLRHPIHYVAGFLRVPLKTYIFYNVSAAGLYTMLWAIIVQIFDVASVLNFFSR
ncbi:DedA family protein [Planococcus donghaensis]|uniref:VTT domain-containing protein n=1 Tax=Planococcus donghaensis TaxID=414778 RepID=A0A1C7EG60_9BACL|nr:VTT domain-containing protein [Planococcus donghaensis]ANU23053.1 hypothetical protein BCM40_06565 [Planococcus donghaensis]